MIGELGNTEETLGMSGSIKENVKDVEIFLDTPIGTLGKTLGCIRKTSSSIQKKTLGDFIFLPEGQKMDTYFIDPKRCWGTLSNVMETSKISINIRKTPRMLPSVWKISRDTNFFSFGRWWMMGTPRKCNEDVGQW
jgi:hypothetical protein